MKTTNRQVIIDLLAKRFSKVLSDDALDALQILMELYSDARELDRVEIEGTPTVEASKPPKQANANAQEDKRRIYQRIRDGYAADGEAFLTAVYDAGEGAIEREELRGMMNGLKYPIARWRTAEEAIVAAGY